MKERDFKTDVENRLYTSNDNFFSLIPYELNGCFYAVDVNANPLLRSYIAASIATYQNRDKGVSVDEIFGSIDTKEDNFDEDPVIQLGILRHVIVENAFTTSQIIKNYCKWCADAAIQKNTFFQIFMTSMARLQNSFKAAVVLLNHGFFVEVIPLFRLILEQIAFGAYLLCETDKDKIIDNQVQKNISHLKTVLGNNHIGKFYNYLSGEAHLEPKEINKYVFYSESDKALVIKNRSGIECAAETDNLLFLMKLYGEIVWKGLNYFGFTTPGVKYFEDWYIFQQELISCLHNSFKNEIQTERVDL